ncbi:uncharacterized protein BBA_09817 [Beauveria bassiana ARSEF 2860]|uniref:Uncharacterized protein n=1 Tax=Beauveria bassiana (strain ARSEF 2860) TaxID=655819 RepID=J4VRK7_BEAB2|nr:uncharacterized protein BBA_09817 [Beauveria bassiana ARSEF 2860]EJP61240.1 hypothetical protein BBA_09817 [Beauveria bassiana ARSEF 2860]
MKYLNIFVICVGLAIAGPVHSPRQYASANKIESICKERGWSTAATEIHPTSGCDLKKRECEKEGKVDEELLTCLNVINKNCNADSECGDGYICRQRPILMVGAGSSCKPKKEDKPQTEQKVTTDTQGSTLTADVKNICENKEEKSQAA